MIENTLGVLHNTSNKSEHTPRGIIHCRSYDVTSCDIPLNPVAILLPVMGNDTFYTNTIVRKKRREITSLPVTWLPFMSHPLAMLLPVMHNCTFRTTAMVRKKARNALPDICRTYFRLWRHFRSNDFMWRHFRSGPLPVTSLPKRIRNGTLPFAPPEIFLELSRYTSLLFGLGGSL